MNLIHIILLGILQGATEFLPVSSSGHLVLAQYYLGIEQPSLFFEVLLHVGTLVAVLFYYRNDILNVVKDCIKGTSDLARGKGPKFALQREGLRIALFVVIASLPTALIGFTLNDYLDPGTDQSFITPVVVAISLIINGAILYSYRWLPNHSQAPTKGPSSVPKLSSSIDRVTLWGLTPTTAFLVGIAQGCAIMPGISRSGLTITAALLLNTRREDAARFSFLLSIPAIVGAFLLKLRELNFDTISPYQWLLYFCGALTATFVGYLCLKWLIHLLKATRFYMFAFYCWALGGIVLLLYMV